MATEDKQVFVKFPLQGRLIIKTDIWLETGLHIGGSPAGIEIGGMSNPIIRNPLTNRPYIPGSSLRGKMRSLLEKYENLPFNQRIQDIYIHGYKVGTAMSDVCHIFGVSSGDDTREVAQPTRLFVRDVTKLDYADDHAQKGKGTYDESQMIEVKWEATIDRVTSAAVPRQQERVSAGLYFRDAEMIFNIYEAKDYDRFSKVLLAMSLLEDDYLGGSGSRGSGKIAFKNLHLQAKRADPDKAGSYVLSKSEPQKWDSDSVNTALTRDGKDRLDEWLKTELPITKPQEKA